MFHPQFEAPRTAGSSSPSAAAAAVLARSANGWNEWKNANGKTIDELYRAQVEEII